MRIAIIVLSFLLNFNFLNAQGYYYPLVGKSNENFSSPYGARDRSPTTYDYDWHATVDIVGIANNVVPVIDGVVIKIRGTGNYQSVFVRHTDNVSTYVAEYKHVLPNVTENDLVIGGTTSLGITADDHLDFRFFDGVSEWGDIDYIKYLNTSHPWEILESGGDFAPPIKIMENDDYELASGASLSLNDAGDGLGNYFEFALRVAQNELDIEFLEIDVWGWTSTGLFGVPELLEEPGSHDAGVNFSVVDFDNLYNCGDWLGADTDEGHNSASVGIYPRKFNSWDPYHTVYFRWYINEDNWSQIDGDVTMDIWARDQYAYETNPLHLSNIAISNIVVGIGDGDNIYIENYSPLIDKNETATFSANYSPPWGGWGIASNWNWSIVLQHDSGVYELQSQYFSGSSYFYNCSWSPLIEQLPTGYNWTLGLDGYIKGYVKVTSQVMNGYDKDIKPIKYNYLSAVKNLQITWVGNHPKLTWEANIEPDIASYKIWKYAGSPSIVATVSNNPNSSTQSWIDYDVTKGGRFASYQFRYKVKAVDNTNNESIYSNEVSIFGNGVIWKIGAEGNENSISTYKLFSNFPNPFNPSTNIEFHIPQNSFVNLTVYNSLGQKVTELVNSNLSIGKYNVEFNADNLPSGLYIYKLQAGEFSSVKKMMLTK